MLPTVLTVAGITTWRTEDFSKHFEEISQTSYVSPSRTRRSGMYAVSSLPLYDTRTAMEYDSLNSMGPEM